MTRVLYWNLENFGINKIANPGTKKRKVGSGISQNEAAQDRLDYITQVIAAAAPEIVVIVEVETIFTGRGALAIGAGLTGCIQLLEEIENALGQVWMMAPPIQTGPTESVGVFYRAFQRRFSGPYVWPNVGAVAAPPSTPPGNYPPEVGDLIGAEQIPLGALQNVGLQQDQCAACVVFSAHGALIDWGVSRAPYMTSFVEMNAAGAVVRNLTLFAIHSPAALNPARNYLNQLGTVEQIVNPLAPNEVRLVIGDFNVNVMGPAPAYAIAPEYNALINPPGHAGPLYALALRPLVDPVGPINGYPTYYATHLRSQGHAVGWSTAARTAYYPGYRYTGGRFGGFAIDNAFTAYGGPAANEPANNDFTILNAVVGSPYAMLAPAPPAGTPPGWVPLARRSSVPPVPPVLPIPPAPNPAPNYTPAIRTQFRSWDNYGHIRSASDHLPLVINI